MKKCISLLFLCIFCVGISSGQTQSFEPEGFVSIEDQPTTLGNLSTGYYAIKAYSKGVTSFLYHVPSATGASQFRMSTTGDDGVNSQNEVHLLKAIWKVQVTEADGSKTVKLQNADSYCIPTYPSQQHNMAGDITSLENAGALTPVVYDDATTNYLTGDNASAIEFYLMGGSNTSIYGFIHTNDGVSSDTTYRRLNFWGPNNNSTNAVRTPGAQSSVALLAFYKLKDVGTADIITDYETLYSVLGSNTKPVGVVGAYPSGTLSSNWKTYTTSYTSESSAPTFKSQVTATSKIALTSGNYYILRASRTDKTGAYRFATVKDVTTDGTALSGNITRTTSDGAVVPMLWQFIAGENSTYTIKSANAGQYMSTTEDSKGTDSNYNYVTLSATATNYTLSGTSTDYTIGYGSNSYGINAIKGIEVEDRLALWDTSDNGSLWNIIPVDSVSLALGTTGWASICYPFDVTKPDGLTVYTAQSVDDSQSSVKLTECTSQTIPANTGFFVTGEANKTYTMAINTSSTNGSNTAATSESNVTLTGVTVSRTGLSSSDGTTNYVLAAKDNTAMLKGMGSVTTIPANKAYLAYTSTTNSATELQFSFGETTGIQAANTTNSSDAPEAYYDLQGRRVLFPTHGIFVKASGQKVYIK